MGYRWTSRENPGSGACIHGTVELSILPIFLGLSSPYHNTTDCSPHPSILFRPATKDATTMIRGTPASGVLSAVACLACLLHTAVGFLGPMSAARGSCTRVNQASSAAVAAISRAPGTFTPAVAARDRVGHAAAALRSSPVGASEAMVMSAGGKKTCIITGASSGEYQNTQQQCTAVG